MLSTGDKVEIHVHDTYMGLGIITAFQRRGSVRLALIESFDGIYYAASESELIKIKE